MAEWEFLAGVVEQADCHLLQDVDNVITRLNDLLAHLLCCNGPRAPLAGCDRPMSVLSRRDPARYAPACGP